MDRGIPLPQSLVRLPTEPKTGRESFHADGQRFEFALYDFWRWSTPHLVSNATRGRLAKSSWQEPCLCHQRWSEMR